MPRWKTTQNILKDGLEFFDENWGNYDRIHQYAPKPQPWNGNRPIRFEDVDLWEVITEMSGPLGVYAAWSPYAEYYVVVYRFNVVAEFEGYEANQRLEKFLQVNKIPYPRGKDEPKKDFSNKRTVLY